MKRTALFVGLLAFAPGLSAQTLDDLAFLAGCWEGPISGGVIEEFWSTPTDNLIVGTTRYIREGRSVQFEFTRIQRDSGSIRMVPYPGGTPSPATFVLTTWSATEAVFEAPEHDYPKRILYRANADASRTARIDGGPDDTGGMEWPMQRVACPGG